MAERKVLVKYYPPDFNPERLIRNQKQTDRQENVRMMLPFSLKCYTCGNYLYIGTKFNMRKETCDEEYLSIPIYRFYMKCSYCYSEITMKTDPKNNDYVCEHGGSRNYEAWRDAREAENTLIEKREQEEKGNAMKFLENRTKDSKREMDILDALDEMKNISRQNAKVTPEQMFEFLGKRDTSKLTENEENLLVDQFKQKRKLQVSKIAENFEKSLIDPEVLHTKRVEQDIPAKLSSSSQPVWKLHSKTILKKKSTEALPSTKSQIQSEDKQENEYKFPPKPPVLCEYSDDDEEVEKEN
jgi:Saf4/Yju2 protein